MSRAGRAGRLTGPLHGSGRGVQLGCRCGPCQTAARRQDLLRAVVRERFGPIVIRDWDDDQPFVDSSRPDTSEEAYRLELLDPWAA